MRPRAFGLAALISWAMLAAGLLATAAFIAACGSSGSSGAATPAAGATSQATAATYAEPFAYCAAVDTIDAPDARYTGPQYPASVVDGLAKASGHPVASGAAPWRCVGGAVWACTVGANLPCGKIDTSKTASDAMNGYCASNPDSPFIPAYISGHDTAYEWSCDGAKAVAGRQVITVDARGFGQQYWYRLTPPSGG